MLSQLLISLCIKNWHPTDTSSFAVQVVQRSTPQGWLVTNESYGTKRGILKLYGLLKKDAKWKGERIMLFWSLKMQWVSFQRKSDVPGVAYFVQRDGSMPILCRGRRGEFTGEKKIDFKVLYQRVTPWLGNAVHCKILHIINIPLIVWSALLFLIGIYLNRFLETGLYLTPGQTGQTCYLKSWVVLW